MSSETGNEMLLRSRLAASYLIFVGATGLLIPLFGLENHPEFEARSLAYKAGAYFRLYSLDVAFCICGIGLLAMKPWARKAALWVLLISTIYGGNEFAWGLSHGKPSMTLMIAAYLVVSAWNAVWFFLIYSSSPMQKAQ